MKTLKYYIKEFPKMEIQYKFVIFTIIFFNIGLMVFSFEKIFGGSYFSEAIFAITAIMMITAGILDEISRRKS